MTWGKVDDNLAFHPKVIVAGNEAMGLWVRALSWSAQQLTDGVIPMPIIAALHGETASIKLVECGLWHEVDGGYEFNDWTDYQPSRQQVITERLAAQERARNARARATAARQAGPVETPPEPRSRDSRLPADFSITSEMLEWANQEVPYFDVSKETKVFVDYWSAKSTNATKKDWVATWRNWMRKAYSESTVSKISGQIAPEVQSKIDAERKERLERQLAQREAEKAARKSSTPIPQCKHNKKITSCMACASELAKEVA